MPEEKPKYSKRHQDLVRWSEMLRQRDLDAHGPYTANPEPPGEGEWDLVVRDMEAFADAGLCELWRMGMEDETVFLRHSDFPPGFNFDCMWWRKA